MAKKRIDGLNKNLTKLMQCYQTQRATETPRPSWLRKSILEQGINLHGCFLSETGLGEGARLVYDALFTLEVKGAACNRKLEDRNNKRHFLDLLSDNAPYKVGIVIEGLISFKGLRCQICKRKYNVAYPFWKLDCTSRKYLSYLEKYDAVWIPSTFIPEILRRYDFTNMNFVKHPIKLSAEESQFFGLAKTLKILFYSDFDCFPMRKNPEAVAPAFKQSLQNKEDVTPTIKARGKRNVGRRHWLAQQASGAPRISIIDYLLGCKAVNALMAENDVFFSLHHSEGLGLGCAEALAACKAVVATDYGGSTEFITTQTGFPVEWTHVRVDPEDYVLADNATWAEPSIDHAAKLLRSIYENLVAAKERAKAGFRHLVENNSFDAVGRNIVSLLYKKGLVVA